MKTLLITLLLSLCAFAEDKPKAVISDADRVQVREIEARIMRAEIQIKDWQLQIMQYQSVDKPQLEKSIADLKAKMAAACKDGETLDVSLHCVAVPVKK